MSKGKYIVIEGAEGVGKTTMVEMTAEQLRAAQLPVEILREPDSQNDLTARAIRRLTQDPRYPMSTHTEVLLYNAARSQSLEVIRGMRDNGVICLVDRSYLTTLAVQYYGRGDVQDYQKINAIIDFAVGDMQPDLTIVLDAPATSLKERVAARRTAERSDDLDEAFLERVRAGYLWEAKQRNLPVIYANDSVETTFKNVWQQVAATLAVRDKATSSNPQSVAEVLAANPPTKAAAVEPPITGNVILGVEPAEPPVLDMASSNLPDETIIDATTPDEVESTTPSTGPIQDFGGQPIVSVSVTKLLAASIQQGRSAAYSETSAHYVDYTQKDTKGRYRYYTPPALKGKLRKQYTQTMDQIFDTYAKLTVDLTNHIRTTSTTPKKQQNAAWQAATRAQACNATAQVLPLATTTSIDIHTSSRAPERLGLQLLSDDLVEAQTVGQQLLTATRTTVRDSRARISSPDQDQTAIAYRTTARNALRQLARDILPPAHYIAETSAATLTDYTPHNELDIVADMLYEYSDLPLETLQSEVTSWQYQRKVDVLTTYLGKESDCLGRALEKIHYSFDLVCNFATFCDLTRHHVVEDLDWQIISPRIGFDVPEPIENANLTSAYEQCFDLSLQLHSALQAKDYQIEAQYAALLGHQIRWKVTYNAREAFRMLALQTPMQHYPDYNKVVQQMHERITEVHPLIAEAVRCANQDKSLELILP